jgi:hypothetical protein
LLQHLYSYCTAAPLLYTDHADESHFIQSLPKDVVKALQDSPIAMENHAKGGLDDKQALLSRLAGNVLLVVHALPNCTNALKHSCFTIESVTGSYITAQEMLQNQLCTCLGWYLKARPQPLRYALARVGAGLSMASFLGSRKLVDFFNVISLSIDRSGNPYVSTLESKDYPIVATQWHPEKNSYEWTPSLHIPHTAEAVGGPSRQQAAAGGALGWGWCLFPIACLLP